MSEWKNKLYYGDNLVWLRDQGHFPDGFVDLIYLDPPFNSNTDYNVIFRESSGTKSPAQLKAFGDTWRWEREASEQAIHELTMHSPQIAELVSWLGRRGDSGSESMAAYLSMMAIRLLELHRVLKPTGSLYLHCDPTASHYLKALLDTIFGTSNFRNEVVWKRQTAHSDSNRCGRIHDCLLFYTKSDKWTWNSDVLMDYDEAYLDTYFTYKDPDGRKFHPGDLTAPGGRGPEYEWNGHVRRWRVTVENMQKLHDEGRVHYTKNGMPRLKRYRDELKGMPLQSIWGDIWPIVSWSKEGLGYQTQKPLALMKRIIGASSNEGDLVLDPFCGCGTTIAAAHDLKRRWIGIDITYLATLLVEERLVDMFGESVKNSYEMKGDPTDVPSAQALWNGNPKEFELWALKLVNARPRAHDGGVDGLKAFHEEGHKVGKVIVQVKGGTQLSPSIIRDLIGTVKKEDAALGLLVSLHTPTKGMYGDAVHEGFYESPLWQKSYPRIQIRTIHELLEEGKSFDLPPQQISPWKKAERVKEDTEAPPLL